MSFPVAFTATEGDIQKKFFEGEIVVHDFHRDTTLSFSKEYYVKKRQ
ncbi:MAG: hypothetical protein ACK4ND_18380 [Cytophagaceae bacterium]